jgi:mannosyl-glycoprotein endo-beta-N-acetylglucosaminidase
MMLSDRIFEDGSEEDCLRLIVGKFTTCKTGQVDQPSSSFTIPLSLHYARLLATLAHDMGFDGYLLNFECPLNGSFEQTRALAAWITVLQSELLDKVGSHAETIW